MDISAQLRCFKWLLFSSTKASAVWSNFIACFDQLGQIDGESLRNDSIFLLLKTKRRKKKEFLDSYNLGSLAMFSIQEVPLKRNKQIYKKKGNNNNKQFNKYVAKYILRNTESRVVSKNI